MRFYSYIISLLFLVSCSNTEAEFGEIIYPSDLSVVFNIEGATEESPAGDGSGIVTFQVNAKNAINYVIEMGDGSKQVSTSNNLSHRYTKVGTHEYSLIVNAVGTGGVATSKYLTINVNSAFDDIEVKEYLSGGVGKSKTWYWSAAEKGHLGVGPSRDGIDGDWWWPKWYEAEPFDKAGSPNSSCLYDNNLVFSLDENNNLSFNLDNKGLVFFNVNHESVVGGTAGDDNCYEYDTSGIKEVNLAPSDSNVPEAEKRGTVMNISDNGFFGYYVGINSYEILDISSNSMYLRSLDAVDSDLAWYYRFTASEPTGDSFETIYTNLVWSDEFNMDGAPDDSKWTYDLGAGGWGNAELQTYTNSLENAFVSNGYLTIKAKKTANSYTSARLKSKGLYSFKYGRVEVKAKLPSKLGTWPAIWMLGDNFDTVGWPNCGEIDIMEQKGQDKTKVLGTLHYPGVSPGAGVSKSTSITNPSSEFHIYSMEWTTDKIYFLLDGKVYHTAEIDASMPFNKNFFFLLNIAMGGTLGGAIDPEFTEDNFIIDYIRVYN